MNENDLILGLFYSDQYNLIYDKFSKDLIIQKKERLKMLSYKFLGPLFFTAAGGNGGSWKIDLIESSLSLHQGRTLDVDILQSFFNLNSSIETEKGAITHLSALIGSPHTEDIDLIYRKLSKYIHPSIIQGNLVAESIKGNDFQFKNLIKNELTRGLNLIEYSLGSSRKMYFQEQKKYYCIGIIERKKIFSKKSKTCNFYSFDKMDPIRKYVTRYLPSFYIMSILPDYYENLIDETLKLFEKTSVFPELRKIKLSCFNKEVLYLEEFLIENDRKESYGVILIPEVNDLGSGRNPSFYRRKLRLILDARKDLGEVIFSINPNFVYDPWPTKTEHELENLKICFDN
jgi:hypothetical protein